MEFLDIIKIAGPYLGGGVAGAILNYFISRRNDNHKKKKASINWRTINYNLPENLFDSEKLQVSYKDAYYESLVLYEIEIKNISFKKILEELTFIFEMSKKTRIIEKKVSQGLEKNEYSFDQNNIESHMLRFVTKNLYCGDIVKVSILAEGELSFNPQFRGDPEIEIVEGNKNISSSRDLESVIGLFSAYTLFGALPAELSAILRAAIIFYNANIFINIFKKYFSNEKSKKTHIEIEQKGEGAARNYINIQ